MTVRGPALLNATANEQCLLQSERLAGPKCDINSDRVVFDIVAGVSRSLLFAFPFRCQSDRVSRRWRG